MTRGSAKFETRTRLTQFSRVKLVLWMNPSACPIGGAAAQR